MIFPCQVCLLSLAFLFFIRKKIGKTTFSHNSHHLVHVGFCELHLDLHHLLKATRGISLPAKKEQCWKVKKKNLEIQVRKFSPTKLMMLNPCIFSLSFFLGTKIYSWKPCHLGGASLRLMDGPTRGPEKKSTWTTGMYSCIIQNLYINVNTICVHMWL